MKEVVATKLGYHGQLREPGTRFMVEDDLEASWFEPVESDGEKPPAAAKPSKGDKPELKPRALV